jgi:hypothetical protein
MLLYLIPVAIPVLAAVAGVLRSRAGRPDPVALLGAAVAGITFAVLAAGEVDPAVAPTDAVTGVVLAALLLGVLPVYVYFVLGRALAQHRIALGLICAATAVPLVFYYLIVSVLIVLELAHCPPDAYECPW